MPIVSVSPAGALGIVRDLRPAELAAEAWSDGKNVQFQQGAVLSVKDATTLESSTPVQFTWVNPAPVTIAGQAAWILAGATAVYGYISNLLTDITRASGPYTGGTTERWSGGNLGGVSVINNGNEPPQLWTVSDVTVKLVDLPNWPASTKAKCLRSFKQYLVALDITKTGDRFPTLVKWSHPADPGQPPSSWNEADPTKDAGEWPISETPGYCVDCVPLRDINVIYKQDSVWGMQYIGGTYIFRFYKMFGDFGIQTRDCAVEYVSGKHFCFTGSDMVIHDGQNVTSVASGRIREFLKTFTMSQLLTSYVAANTGAKEVWVCIRLSTAGPKAADTAIVWNWDDGTISLRSLPDYKFIATGRLDPPVTGVETWGTVAGSWAEHAEEWGESVTLPSQLRMFAVGVNRLDWVDSVPHSGGYCWVERKYLGIALQASKAPDLSVEKFISRWWPRFTGTVGDVVNITLGACDNPAKPVVWRAPKQFIIGVHDHVDLTLSGKLFSIKIDSTNTNQWTFNGMDAEVIATGAG